MRNGLTIGLAVTAMTLTCGLAAVSDARSEQAVDTCVCVTPDPAPFYVRGPRIIHVPRPGEAIGRRVSEPANSQVIIIHRQASRVGSRHSRHGHKTPLPRQKPPILAPERAVSGAPTLTPPAPPVPQEVSKTAQPDKIQSSGPADVTATVPSAEVRPAVARPAEPRPVPATPQPAAAVQAAPVPSPSPTALEPVLPAVVGTASDAKAAPADTKSSAVDTKAPDAKAPAPDALAPRSSDSNLSDPKPSAAGPPLIGSPATTHSGDKSQEQQAQ